VQYRLPADGDDVVLGASDHVLLDVQTPSLNRLTIDGWLEASHDVHSQIRARSVLVWGTLTLGTPDDPLPSNVTARVSLYGEADDHTVVMTEGLFLVNKVLAVLGTLSAAGAPIDAPLHAKLATTAWPGRLIIRVAGDLSGWAEGALVAIGPTEYPLPPATTEAETVPLAAVPVYSEATGTSTLTLSQPLRYRHFAGRVLFEGDGAHTPTLDLAATVALVGGRSNVLFETAEPDTEHGGVVTIGGSVDGAWVGKANLSNVEFSRMGKAEYQAPALHLNLLGASRLEANQRGRASSIVGCVFSRSQAGAVQVDGARELLVRDNVFHRTYRTALWIGSGTADDAVEIVGNVALETLRHPRAPTDWVDPFAAFLIEVRPLRLEGNIAAGSTDSGFVLRPHLAACVGGDDSTPPVGLMNEAVGCLTGFFLLKACTAEQQCNTCMQLRGALAWKNAHAGVLTVDQNANARLSELVLADNHIGVTLNFLRSKGDMRHRVYYHNITVLGSTRASTCSASTTCRAIGQFGEADPAATIGATCNSVLGSGARRVGVLAHMVNSLGKLCESSSKLSVCRPPNRPVKECVMPWEHRLGTVGSRYSEAHWSAVTFGHFAERDCSQRSYAFGYNPTSIDANFPNAFSDVKFLPSAESSARLRLDKSSGSPTNRVDDCKPGGECDGLSNMLLIDKDGSLLGGDGPSISGAGGTALPIEYGNLAHESCVGQAGVFACVSKRLRWLSWEAPGITNVQSGRQLGRFKAWRAEGERASWSRGPYGDMCLPSDPEQIRTWTVLPGSEYNLTMFASPPANMRLRFFDDEPSSALRLAIFLTQPFRLDVYVDGVQLGASLDASDEGAFGGEGAPRYPTLTDAHGTHAFDPHQRRFYLTMRGGADRLTGSSTVLLRMSMVVQLSLTATVPIEEFDGPSLLSNLATLLQIDRTRIKVVSVQSRAQIAREQADAARRRALQQDNESTAILVQISEPLEAPSAGLLDGDAANGTDADMPASDFSAESLAELQALAAVAWQSAQPGEAQADMFSGGVFSIESFPLVSDPTDFQAAAPPPPSPPLDGLLPDSGALDAIGSRVVPKGTSGDAAADLSFTLMRYVIPIVGALVLLGGIGYYAHARLRYRASDRAQVVVLMDDIGSIPEPQADRDAERSARYTHEMEIGAAEQQGGADAAAQQQRKQRPSWTPSSVGSSPVRASSSTTTLVSVQPAAVGGALPPSGVRAPSHRPSPAPPSGVPAWKP
jgi:hypothetical protein